MVVNIYISVFLEQSIHWVDVESLIILYVFQVCKTENVQLNIKFCDKKNGPIVSVDLSQFDYKLADDCPVLTEYCLWPIIIVKETLVSGLSSVARQIIKSSRNEETRYLLGFRESCLAACSETSIWTRFCEIDMPNTIKTFLSDTFQFNPEFELPKSVTEFNFHLGQPVKAHNVYKLAKLQNKNKKIDTTLAVSELDLEHKFSEGPFMTLADILLFPCFQIFFEIFDTKLTEELRLIYKWFDYVKQEINFVLNVRLETTLGDINFDKITHSPLARKSLYISDPKRHQVGKRPYTRQEEIDVSLKIILDSECEIKNDNTPYGNELIFDWSRIPLELNPTSGSLPQKRANRKCEQLENLTKAAFKLAKDKHTIVDFCSGSGHLGLLLAYLLPDCEIILVENKERSLLRAKKTIQKLSLFNVTILQCNLDYFTANFEVGVALHACGVATDLVIQMCIKNNADFLCCPCCYGGVRDCHQVQYPRSDFFKRIFDSSVKNYFNISHAADQTHDAENVKTAQGFFCMDIIDNDRMFYAKQFGYEVHLGKLQPVTCTNKNNLLVGIRL